MITPGLIDLHNHLAYNFLPLWPAPRELPYTSRHQWPSAATYGRDVSNPAQAMGIVAAAAALRFAEVRAAAGGATAIQGSPPLTRAFPGWMVRNVEKEQIAAFGDEQRIFQAVIKADVPKLRTYATRLAGGSSFIYHLAEGTADTLVGEYDDLREAGCVHPNLIGIHSTALGADQYEDWASAGPGAVVWSPFSNIWLYGDTTDVLAARRHGHLVCLGSDWGPSGTKNLLGELKVAALWNDEALAGALDDRELGMMATANAGDALARCWGVDVGRLRPGALADVLVTTRRDPDPHRNLLRSDERGVRLVIVGGRPVLGTPSILAAAGVPAADIEPLVVGGVRKGVVMKLPEELLPPDPALRAEATMSWADGVAAMAALSADPAGAVRQAVAERERRPRGAPVPAGIRAGHAGGRRQRGWSGTHRRRARPARRAPATDAGPRRGVVPHRRRGQAPRSPPAAAARALLTSRAKRVRHVATVKRWRRCCRHEPGRTWASTSSPLVHSAARVAGR